MDYNTAFVISASGMTVQKIRMDTVALNLANVNTTRSISGGPFKRLHVIVAERAPDTFARHLQNIGGNRYPAGVEVVDILPLDEPPRLVYEPAHPDANEKGFVQYPNINPVSETVTLLEATRAYEANVRAFNAAKAMATSALQIGRGQ